MPCPLEPIVPSGFHVGVLPHLSSTTSEGIEIYLLMVARVLCGLSKAVA